LRSEIVPAATECAGAHELDPAAQGVFDINVERCPNCGGALKIIVAAKIRRCR
jgi:hypothetical protein